MMKKIFLITALLLSCYSFSQRGFGRPVMPDMPQNTSEEMSENIEKAQKESVKNLMTRLNNELNLNQLQSIAIEKIYIESNRKQGIVFQQQLPDEEKRETLISINEAAEKKVLELLDSSQKEKFLLLKPTLMKGTKKDSKKKKKEDKKDKEE